MQSSPLDIMGTDGDIGEGVLSNDWSGFHAYEEIGGVYSHLVVPH